MISKAPICTCLVQTANPNFRHDTQADLQSMESPTTSLQTHKDFDEKMALKTIINSGCTKVINATPNPNAIMNDDEDDTASHQSSCRRRSVCRVRGSEGRAASRLSCRNATNSKRSRHLSRNLPCQTTMSFNFNH